MKLSQLTKYSIKDLLFLLLLGAYPVFLPTVRHWGSTLFLFLILSSVYMLIKHKPELEPEIKFYLKVCGVLMLFCLLSFYNSSDVLKSWKQLQVVLYLLGFFPVALVAKDIGGRATDFLIGGIAGCGIATTIYSFFEAGPHLSGAYFHIFLGEIAALCAVILLASLLLKSSSSVVTLFYFIGFSCSVYASLLTGSRGAWLGMLAGITLTLILAKGRLLTSRNTIFLISILLLFFVVAYMNRSFVATRVLSAAQDIEQYQHSGEKQTSLGQRFLMWSVAFNTWKEHPLIGSGLGDFKDDLRKANESENSPGLPLYAQAHSLYMDSLSSLGTFGFLSLMAVLFLLPTVMMYSVLKMLPESARYLAVAGLGCLVAFAVFGLTDSWLNRRGMVAFYAILLAIFWGGCRSATMVSTDTGE